MTDRRYNDEEMAAIFRAASQQASPLPAREVPGDEGMSLTDLQSIGREVGIAPEAIAQAAIALEVQRDARSRTLLGLPIGVSRTVDLQRNLSDAEWERLVVQLRDVFHARGVTRTDGSLRQWTNGNLHVLLEPTEKGHRLRFGTYNAAARSMMGVGAVALGVTVVTAISTSISGHFGAALPGLAMMAMMGVGAMSWAALRLPGWARLRARQMESLAAQVATLPSPTATAPAALPGETRA